eukprot:CAMPEP_0117638426 /NCGR_PEP_ID=MMETSP0802-20121206/7814_1 /TAXON_ID=38833 /ORGANISM="Micromonas sp., Strain CCMP2099" /LENGTH=130 /DNA_ID=CAMNT_0005443345 /DNA_START=17 /DNA_END=405 /DNA_ORIENTATION=+
MTSESSHFRNSNSSQVFGKPRIMAVPPPAPAPAEAEADAAAPGAVDAAAVSVAAGASTGASGVVVSVAMGGSWMTDFRSASAAAACTFVSFTFVSSTLGRCALSAPASVSAERFAPRTGDCGVSGIVVSA